MSFVVSVATEVWENENIEVNVFPDCCPWCDRTGDMKFVTGCIYEATADRAVQLIFRCYNNHCRKLMIADYLASARSFGAPHYLYTVWPSIKRPKLTFKNDLKEFSPRFCEVMLQAASAENAGLSEICGPGYRKALEILIKDFLIKHQEDDADAVIKDPLMTCIKARIKDDDIKECAKRAVQIGNDETHYERELVDVDVAVMKELIELTVSYVEKELAKKRIFALMPDKAKKK